MTSEQKIIRAKVGLLELAKQLGNVSQACKMMGYSRIASTASGNSMTKAASWLAGDHSQEAGAEEPRAAGDRRRHR